jgi:two-component system CheB/CheR fusion protein
MLTNENRPPPSRIDAERLDEDALQPPARNAFPIIGIGASAGGLEAITQLLRALPVDTGMAFVLVQHLSPTHESALAQILSRATAMPVAEVTDEPAVEPNHVYVIPPDRNMLIEKGHLRLQPRDARGVPHPIDMFFSALAHDQGERAIGVILSGTATDGTIGLEAIKAAGGITFAQDHTAQYDEMPRSAMAAGCVDYMLSAEEIAGELRRIAVHPYVGGNGGSNGVLAQRPPPDKAELTQILTLLRKVTGVDFMSYKTNTLARRITRRMVLRKKDSLADYERVLRDTPLEVEALFRDILINVTSFFRDPELFDLLRSHVIPALRAHQVSPEPLRVWALGCSTGEEAYSLAMTFAEASEESGGDEPAQIFATDLNAAAVEHARAGVYARERLHDVSPARLRRFFTEDGPNYRIAKSIRDMCVFAQHNVMADPPFSRIDLISCRNLLIYMEPGLQQQLMPLFHYALRPGGYLVLGASETVGNSRDLFHAEDTVPRIFVRKAGAARRPVTLPITRSTGRPGYGAEVRSRKQVADPTRAIRAAGVHPVQNEIDRVLLARFAPASVVVNADLEILQFRGQTEPYLVPAQGLATFSLLKMAREDVLVPLLGLLRRAKQDLVPVREPNVRVRSNGAHRSIDLEVVPVTGSVGGETVFIVLFEVVARSTATVVVPGAEAPESESRIATLEGELARTRESLQALIEQQDTVNAELQSVNEEAHSANEELQSINEELETSKEEIQSSNEELSTVNDELNSRILESHQLNSDLTNLIGSVQMAILIVGKDLRIRRFSPVAETLMNVNPSDVGRPVTEIRMALDVPDMHEILTEAIATGGLKEREVRDRNGHWYLLRIRPSLTATLEVDGAVLLLIDIDRLKLAERAIAHARDQVAHTLATVREPLLVLDADLRLESANPSFFRSFGVTPEQAIGQSIFDLGNRQWDIPRLRSLMEELLPGHKSLEGFELEHVFPGLGARCLLLNARRIENPAGETERILLAIEDITESEVRRKELQDRIDELAEVDASKGRFLAVLSHELRSPLSAIRGWLQILQRPETTASDRDRGLDVIDRNSRIQVQLIDDLLDAHRIGSGKLALDLTLLDLRETVEAAISACEPAAEAKRIVLARDLDPAPTPVSGDSGRLLQALGNLIGNAIKFTPEGGEVRVELRRTGGNAEINVRDHGAGIAAGALPSIFDPFRQGESDSNRQHRGLGLGLSIARQLVHLHGGSIHAHSEGKGRGATFTITLPLRTEESIPRIPVLPHDPARIPKGRLAGAMVLIVDDEADAREPVRRVLEEVGAEVVAVGSADEALAVLRQQRPDVIVSDIEMPGTDGYELIRRIRGLPAAGGGDVPAIALTSHGTLAERDRAFAVGFSSHLTKPADAVLLVAAIAELLPQRS